MLGFGYNIRDLGKFLNCNLFKRNNFAGIRKFDENNDLDLMYDGYLFFVFLHPISTNFHHLNVFPDTVFY
ncbi:hypothetical protein RCL_jg2912.t1 [Rhizophagus clarus]|uniref:Uncharacterized protein n=1 Tax=Rhizophagus clarus TaxID=94130 RepID=A0A8H3M6F9_9GLOM|nr:hypothetical protein RCL_jg2912.t1 [Rhizophagus clarus]